MAFTTGSLQLRRILIVLAALLVIVFAWGREEGLGRMVFAQATIPDVPGNTYYVALDGNDNNPGTLESPWATIAKANRTLKAGDQVLLRAGIYYDVIDPANSGRAGRRIIYRSYPGEQVTIAGTADRKPLVRITKSYITVDGFHITYPHNLSSGGRRWEWVVIIGEQAEYNEILNCHIRRDGDPLALYRDDYREWGIVVSSARHTLIEGNTIRGLNQGIQIKEVARYTQVRNNTITESGQSSIVIGSSRGSIQGTLIEGNLLEHSYVEDGIQFHQNFDAPDSATDISNLGVIIRGNIIRDHAENAIDLKGAAHVVIEENMIYGTIGSNDGALDGWNRNSMGAIIRGMGASTRDIIIRNNVFYDNAGGTWLFDGWKIYHNVFVGNNRDYTGPNSSHTSNSRPPFVGIYQIDPTPKLVGIKNNIFANHNSANVSLRTSQLAADMDIDYNGYQGQNADHRAPQGYHLAPLREWQQLLESSTAISGNDENSHEYDDLAQIKFANVPLNPTGDHQQFDFTLRSDSPLRAKGGPLTLTVRAGRGRTIQVVDAGYFFDGFGVAEGDLVQVGADQVVRVLSIDYEQNTLTIDRAIEWSNQEEVSLPFVGQRPDIGLQAFGSHEPAQDVEIRLSPSWRWVPKETIFDLAVVVTAKGAVVDSAAVYLDFDPQVLKVVRLTPGDVLTATTGTSYDNTLGHIGFAAENQSGRPYTTGSFVLVTITLQSVAETLSTKLPFRQEAQRHTDVVAAGQSILRTLSGGEVVVQPEMGGIFLPLVLR
jgi:parallel beta-helix repeat protein